MALSYVSAVAIVWSLLWNYNFQKEDILNQERINSQCQRKVNEWEQRFMALEQRDEVKPQQHEKSSTILNLPDDVSVKSAVPTMSGSFPLPTVFLLLLIHTSGASVFSAASTASLWMNSAGGFMNVTFGLITVGFMYRWKCENTELVEKQSQCEKESRMKEEEFEDVVSTVMEVKRELENWRSQLKRLQMDVEKEKEENKERLQSVEDDITARERNYDKPEGLLKEKERLLQDQWKLDQTKKDTEWQLLKIEKLMEPIDAQVTRIRKDTNTKM